MWGLPWGLIFGTSGRKDLCMVPCHSCHIYGIWTSRSKKVWGMFKSHQLGVVIQLTKGWTLFIGKANCHCVILLYCETLLQAVLGIYCKKFYLLHLFTIQLLFYVSEVGKAKCATQCVLMKYWMGYSRNIFKFFTLSLKIHYPWPYPLLPLFFFHYSVCTVISESNHPFDKSIFTHTVSQGYIIAIENTYLNEVFLKSKISIFP